MSLNHRPSRIAAGEAKLRIALGLELEAAASSSSSASSSNRNSRNQHHIDDDSTIRHTRKQSNMDMDDTFNPINMQFHSRKRPSTINVISNTEFEQQPDIKRSKLVNKQHDDDDEVEDEEKMDQD